MLSAVRAPDCWCNRQIMPFLVVNNLHMLTLQVGRVAREFLIRAVTSSAIEQVEVHLQL